MKDIAALPTNMGLTLWDALPVYVGVSLAVALLARVWLPTGLYAWYWTRRRLLDLAGLLYLVLYAESFAIVYAALMLLAVVASGLVTGTQFGIRLRQIPKLPLLSGLYSDAETPPATPARAMRTIFSDTVAQLLVAGTLAALVNILGPRIPDGPLWLAVSLGGALALGPDPGPAAIPAVAAASTSGTALIGVVWLALAFGVCWLHTVRALDAGAPETMREHPTTGADA